jgi:hypothetical protein
MKTMQCEADVYSTMRLFDAFCSLGDTMDRCQILYYTAEGRRIEGKNRKHIATSTTHNTLR